jgi:hypothetical protein
MSRLLYAAAVLSSILLCPTHAQSPFTPAPLDEDILQKVRDWQAASNPKPPTEFRAGHVTPRKLGKDALQAKPGGFEVTLPSGAPLTTPAVYDGKVFSSGGFHSKEFDAVDAKTGQLVWSLDLDDDGPSSAACDAGRCAFNTESCTLFVVDANTGKQVRSLWLGDPLTSAPAIADGRVYTSYPAGGHASASHVLAAFDLQTGKILWQRWIDSDVQSAPVVAEGKVYASTFGGSVYQLDAKTGEFLSARQSRATSAPTIAGGVVHYSARADNAGGRAQEALATRKGQAERKLQEKEAKYLDGEIQQKAAYAAQAKSLDAMNGFGSGAPVSANATAAGQYRQGERLEHAVAPGVTRTVVRGGPGRGDGRRDREHRQQDGQNPLEAQDRRRHGQARRRAGDRAGGRGRRDLRRHYGGRGLAPGPQVR